MILVKTKRKDFDTISNLTYINQEIRIIQKDIITDNGIIHVIDNIILRSFL